MKIKYFLILIPLLLSGKVISQSNIKTVESFILTTKIDLELNQINSIINNKVESKRVEIDSKENFLKFSTTLKESFNSTEGIYYLKEYFLKNENEVNLNNIIDLYKKPLMVKMSKYEIESTNPENKENQITFFKGMKENPPKKSRIELLLNLNKTLKATARTKNLLEEIMLSFYRSYNVIKKEKGVISLNDLKLKINSELPPSLSQNITNQFVALGLYTYRDVTDSDLKSYIKVWETNLGKEYVDMTFKAYKYTFDKMTLNLITNLNNTF